MTLAACPNCGFCEHNKHSLHPCSAKAGAAAKRLRSCFPDVPSTQLGYSERGLAFEFSDDCTACFRVDDDGTLTLDQVFWKQRISLGHAAQLVKGLADAAAAFANKKGRLL